MSTLAIIGIIIGADIVIDLILFAVIVSRLRKRVWGWRNMTPIEVKVYRNW